MRILYYLKNLRVTENIKNFIQKKLGKIERVTKKEEALVEVELIKDKEVEGKKGLYKAKIILDLPKRTLIVAKGVGKNIMQAVNSGFKKLFRQLRRKP